MEERLEEEGSRANAKPARSWWGEGLRCALFMPPRWNGLRATPLLVVGLVIASVLLSVIAHRLYIVGPARFYWPALLSGWFATAVTIAACWWMAPRDQSPAVTRAPSAPALFAMFMSQWLVAAAMVSLVMVLLVRISLLEPTRWGIWTQWLAWGLPTAWALSTMALLFWRGGHGSARLRAGSIAAVAAATILSSWATPMQAWYPDTPQDDSAAAAADRFEWTPALLEAQAQTLPQRLDAVAAQQPGVVDVYALTYAPYGDEDVFLRESRLVADVMESRFGAANRSVQLLNHRSTAEQWPWATPRNLERAIAKMAERMDRDEDLFFIHLTSHGAKSGHLATSFWPIKIDALTPAQLKAALDAAGVRFRVISVSACYAGSWIAPLADDNTLVMTAADADHTSYGCGRGSDLTYFGRAMYDEALRSTWSFESALASARGVIEQREKDAGKTDGFSNPQIHVGHAIRERLKLLEQQRAASLK